MVGNFISWESFQCRKILKYLAFHSAVTESSLLKIRKSENPENSFQGSLDTEKQYEESRDILPIDLLWCQSIEGSPVKNIWGRLLPCRKKPVILEVSLDRPRNRARLTAVSEKWSEPFLSSAQADHDNLLRVIFLELLIMTSQSCQTHICHQPDDTTG